MMGCDRRTHNGWVGHFLSQRIGKLNAFFCNFLSHSTWAITDVNLGTLCAWVNSLRRRHYQEVAPKYHYCPGKVQWPLWLLKSREWLGCPAAQKDRLCFPLHPMPQASQLNLWLMAATVFQVIGNEADEGRRETKPTKFILCLFWMAVLSENSQEGAWVMGKGKVHVQRDFLFKVFCSPVYWKREVRYGLQETSSVKKMVLKTWEEHCGCILKESIIYASFLLGKPWHELLVTVGGKTQSYIEYLFNPYYSFSHLCYVKVCLHSPLGSKWISERNSHQWESHQCLFLFFFPSLKQYPITFETTDTSNSQPELWLSYNLLYAWQVSSLQCPILCRIVYSY